MNEAKDVPDADALISWVQQCLDTLGYGGDKYDKVAGQEAIVNFTHGAGPKTLVVTGNDDGQVKLSCEEDILKSLELKNLRAYLLRSSHGFLSRDVIAKEVQYGTVSGKGLTLSAFTRLMKGLVERQVSRNADLSGHYHRCMATLTDTVHCSDGSTVLYFPNFDFASIQEAAADKEQLQIMESIVIHWTSQIKDVINNHDGSASAETSGPLDEIEFWKGRTKNLLGIQHQLEKPDAGEANDNLKYLESIREHCTALHTIEAEKIVTVLPELLSRIRLIWSFSRHYNDNESISGFLRKMQFVRKSAETKGDAGPIPKFGGTKAQEILDGISSIQSSFEVHVERLRNLDYDFLDVRVSKWHDDYHSFKNAVKDLEVMYTNVINGAFESATTVMDNFETSRVNPPLRIHEPQYAGSALWAQSLFAVVKEGYDALVKVQHVLSTREFDEFKEQYDTFESAMKGYKNARYNIWMDQLTEKAKDNGLQARLDKCIMKRADPDQKHSELICNFDEDLLMLFSEVSYWEKFQGEYSIPYVAHDLCNRRDQLRVMRELVMLIVRAYNEIVRGIEPEQRRLFVDHMRKLDRRMNQGLNKLTWQSKNMIEMYVRDSITACQEVHAVVKDFKECKANIAKLCKQITNLLAVKIEKSQLYEGGLFERKQEAHRQSIMEQLSDSYTKIISTLKSIYPNFKDGTSEVKREWRNQITQADKLMEQSLKHSVKRSLQELSRAINGDSKSDPQTLFTVQIILDASRVTFMPTMVNLTHSVNVVAKDIIGTVTVVPRIKSQNFSGESYYEIISDDNDIIRLVLQVMNGMSSSATELQKYLSYWDKYKTLWEMDKDMYIRKYERAKKPPSMFDVDISRYRTQQSEIISEASTHIINFVRVDCNAMKDSLVGHCMQCQNKLTTLLNSDGKDKLKGIFKLFQDSRDDLTVPPKDLDELSEKIETCRNLKETADEINMLGRVDEAFEEHKSMLFDAEKMLEKGKVTMKRDLEQQMDHYSTQMDEIRDSSKTELPYSSDKTVEEALAIIETYKGKAAKARLREEQIAKGLSIFAIKSSEHSSLTALQKDLDFLDQIWNVTIEWSNQWESWKNGQFGELHVDDLDLVAGNFMKRELDKFRDTVPLIADLRNPAMRSRHWASLQEKIGQNFDPKSPEFTLNEVVKLGLNAHSDFIALEDLDKRWDDDISQFLEDDSVALSTMKASKFYGSFQTKIDKWENTLSTISEVIESSLDVQRKWIYLESIFMSGGDISKQLPKEHSLFLEVNTSFCKKIQKSLDQYLETKRMVFPRFYFDPVAVQKHIKKCFEGVKNLKLNPPSESAPFADNVAMRRGISKLLLQAIQAVIRGPLNSVERNKIVALITMEIHNRDVMEKMVKQNCSSVSDFEWLSQLRFIFIKEGAEFGKCNNGRLVVTPLTDLKDLGKNLAKYVVVMNCSDGMDYKSVGRIFSGLVQSGSWGCFDEFNRIKIEVISVVAMQISDILSALTQKLPSFYFMGVNIKCNLNCGIFITMNPGYAGRTELPDNLKALMRPVAMMAPDLTMIAEKTVTLYSNLKAVLNMAGQLKRSDSNMPEESILMRALRDMNLPKFIKDDERLFRLLLGDLFPNLELPGLQLHDFLIGKIFQFYDSRMTRHCNMLVGDPMGGNGNNDYMSSIELDELYGAYDLATFEWKDDHSRSGSSLMAPILTLINGDRIPLSQTMSLVFETQDLSVASPATVSRAGMIYIDAAELGWETYTSSWLNKKQLKEPVPVPDFTEPAFKKESLQGDYASIDSIMPAATENMTFHDMIVPTVDTVRNGHMVETLVASKEYVLLVGATGTGKTVLAQTLLNNLPETHGQLVINFSAATTSGATQEILEGPMEKRSKDKLGPQGGKNLVVFVDDFNMPLIRLWMDYSGWYDRVKCSWKYVLDTQIIASMGHPGGGRNEISGRTHILGSKLSVLMVKPAFVYSPESLLRLWVHECQRVISDRFIRTKSNDEQKFRDIVGAKMNETFQKDWTAEVHDYPKLRAIVEEKLEDYNMEPKLLPMDLAMFSDATMHITRIYRILSQARGNMMLIGVGGSGRSSLARLSSYIASMNVFTIEITKNYRLLESNLHVILAMSPVGPDLRERCKMYPGLVNCTTIDFFHTWPAEALQEVAMKFLASVEFDEEEFRPKIAAVFADMHLSVINASDRMLLQLKRHNYVTPTNYLELVKGYRLMLAKKRGELSSAANKLANGLAKLEDAKEQVEVLSKELEVKKVVVAKSQKSCEDLLVNIKKQVEADSERISIEAEECKAISDDAEADLAVAMPALEKAMEEVDKLDKSSVSEPTDWASAKQVLGQANFLAQIKGYDKDNVSQSVNNKIKKFVENPDFEVEAVRKVSGAAAALLAPKRQKLKEATDSLALKQASLKEAQEALAAILEKLQKLQEAYDSSAKLDRADKLVKGLEGEYVTGDSLVSAAFISYAGPFETSYRHILTQEWAKSVDNQKLPITDNFNLTVFLADPTDVRDWQIQGLPRDDFSTENGVISTSGGRWPLMIDPQGQANRWIRNMEGKELRIIDLKTPGFLRDVENAVQYGFPVLLQDILEEMDPALEPELDYSPDFKLYITTKLSNPHYTPEISTKACVVNFAVKKDGLEAQLLGIVVQKEEPTLETQKSELTIRVAKGKRQLVDLENEILRLLSETQGSLLDDADLVNTLQASKVTSEEVTEQLKVAEETEKKIDAARLSYRPAAIRSSLAYFVLDDMARVDPMYQFSLDAYVELFNLSIDSSRIANYTCRGLFEEHKLLFSLSLCSQIMRSKSTLVQDEFDFFSMGPGLIDRAAQPGNPAQDWIPQLAWDNVTEMDKNSKFITANIGPEFVDPPAFDLKSVYDTSSAKAPLIFVLSPVALGQGQAPTAMRLISDALKNGTWVFLANCHLMLSWMPTLEKLIEAELVEGTPPKSFRLWLSSSPTQEFPISILQRGIKMTTEPPKGLRSNLMTIFNTISEDQFGRCSLQFIYKKLLFALFKSLGFNIPYDFNESDFAICHDLIIYLIAEANYGGRYALSELPEYFIPEDGDLKFYKEAIRAKRDVREKMEPRSDPDPLKTVLYQEIDRYNALLSRMRSNLSTIIKCTQGTASTNAELEEVMVALGTLKVPRLWGKTYPSLKPLGSWIVDLQARVDFFVQWIDVAQPVCWWLPALTYPTGFLTAILQVSARMNGVSIDSLSFETPDGVYVSGSRPMELLSNMPIIHFKPVEGKRKAAKGMYTCPLYMYPVRSGTRERPSFVYSLDIRGGRFSADFWTKRAVGLLLSTAS
eukprot:GSChrysophyteH1.ASY1.ANO1.273.1 assembled CDS